MLLRWRLLLRFLQRRCSSFAPAAKPADPRLSFVSRELEVLSGLKTSSGGAEGFVEGRRRDEGAKEAVLSHRWPEWDNLVETLQKNGYLDRSDVEKGYVALSKNANRVRTACLDYARHRSELIRFLPREDIQVIVGSGCPSTDRKVTNSGKRLRAYVGIDEGKVCSSCNMRGSCERAYLNPREEERGRTADIMRILLTYALELASGSTNTHPPLTKPLEESARRILRGLVDLDAEGKNPPTVKKVNALLKPGDWICPKCEFLNFAKNIKCLRCNDISEEKIKKFKEEFQHLPLKKGDWICSTCNFLNFAKNTRCMQCEGKPTGRQLNPGEWECSSCNYVNFRKNEYCLKCNWKRPKVVADDRDDAEAERRRVTRISFVGDDPPYPPPRKESTVMFRESSVRMERSSSASIYSKRDGYDDDDDDDDEMAGWFGPRKVDGS